ncbi:MAG: enoyl-CoA hydratase/isomerase family protein [Deltaproteobacteria bacterium]|nr:enoyl-CoA hydratase/isomerase family protein [Deltaproteobacteria bacterium]
MAYNKIIVERKDGVAKVILNRPEAMNALDEEMLTEMAAAFRELDAEEGVHVIILTGAGRAFSAGRDLRGVLESRERVGGARYRVLEEIGKPVIAAVNGPCFTGAFELALCADIVIASEKALFGDTHARFGLIPGGGQTQRLPRQIGPKKAKELLFTCEPVTAQEALRLGIVNRVVPAEQLDEAAMEMAGKILRNIPEAIRTMKSLVNEGMKTDLESGLRMEADLHKGPIAPAGEGRNRMVALLEKR